MAPWRMLGSTLRFTEFVREGLLWGAGCAGEPHDLIYGRVDTLVEGGDLALEVYKEGI